jgi:glycosyltransferase involved in cell wall biosynthesis
MRILHVFLELTATSPEYNEHCLPQVRKHEIGICTYFVPTLETPSEVSLYPGDGSVRTFFANIDDALGGADYDIVHLHAVHVAVILLVCSGIRNYGRLNTVYTFHDSYQNYKHRNRIMLWLVLAWARRGVCCGQASRQSIPRLLERLVERRLRVVPNGVDLARIDGALASSGAHAHREGVTVASIGRMQPVKNHSTVLEAFAASAEEGDRLILMGDGALRQALSKEAATLGLDGQVEFPGIIPRDDVFACLRDADLFVSASRGEGLPVAVLEAMACRCPVVLSDIPPHREIADQSDFVPLVAPDDASGFAKEMRRILGISPEKRRRLGEQCRKLVEERFSLQQMQEGYAEIYDELTSADEFAGRSPQLEDRRSEV